MEVIMLEEFPIFSWWNCDAQFPTVSLTVNVFDASRNQLPYVSVQLIRNNSTNPVISQADDHGQVSGLIPSNEVLTMKIIDLCSNVVYTSTIGPFSSDTTINIVLDNVMPTNVVGNLVKCDKSKVTNGYVKLVNGNQSLICNVTDGNFNFRTLVCNANNNFSLIGFDIEGMQTTGDLNYSFSSAVTNLGDIPACNSVTEFISYKVNNDPVCYIFNNIDSHVGSYNPLYIQGNSGLFNQPGVSIYGNSTNVGTYSLPNTAIGIGFRRVQGNIVNGYSISSSTGAQTCIIKINKYGAVGDYIDIAFSGSSTLGGGEPLVISGVAHIIRDN
ncbi:hypothetical protein LZZ90_07985 [Flavobacterium sp. SM15]|uniref:hypothetical protein n=1 Tax=Flavobacterium sp. SM15 TaxID=2908005 RepID=UPI001ED9D2F9|nr:hypothetical protein [Flavobacterium sp. SM15]MCG2611444.1 hypothetical protein [Flavobacterium sp. SM15]